MNAKPHASPKVCVMSTTPSAAPAAPAPLPTLDHIEEDDEFEEFETQGNARAGGSTSPPPFELRLADWTEVAAASDDTAQWVGDWDDENVDDDFCRHLRAELTKAK